MFLNVWPTFIWRKYHWLKRNILSVPTLYNFFELARTVRTHEKTHSCCQKSPAERKTHRPHSDPWKESWGFPSANWRCPPITSHEAALATCSISGENEVWVFLPKHCISCMESISLLRQHANVITLWNSSCLLRDDCQMKNSPIGSCYYTICSFIDSGYLDDTIYCFILKCKMWCPAHRYLTWTSKKMRGAVFSHLT